MAWPNKKFRPALELPLSVSLPRVDQTLDCARELVDTVEQVAVAPRSLIDADAAQESPVIRLPWPLEGPELVPDVGCTFQVRDRYRDKRVHHGPVRRVERRELPDIDLQLIAPPGDKEGVLRLVKPRAEHQAAKPVRDAILQDRALRVVDVRRGGRHRREQQQAAFFDVLDPQRPEPFAPIIRQGEGRIAERHEAGAWAEPLEALIDMHVQPD